MAVFLHWSDLHTEHESYPLPEITGRFDGVLLAGDISAGVHHVSFLKQVFAKYGVPVRSILGNHEYYGHTYAGLNAAIKAKITEAQAEGFDIDVLMGEQVKIAGVNIFGATLWVDFQYNVISRPIALRDAYKTLWDFTAISKDDNSGSINGHDMLAWHEKDYSALRQFISGPALEGPSIVMTHHSPHPDTINPVFAHSNINHMFCSDFRNLMRTSGPDFWIYGHMHSGREFSVQRSRGGHCHLRHNPRGYPQEDSAFNPLRCIDTDNPDRINLYS